MNGIAALRYRIHPIYFGSWDINAPFPSPDGRYLAVTADYQDQSGLQIIDTQTRQSVLLKYEDEYPQFDHWEADSQHFILKISAYQQPSIYLRGDVTGAIVPLEPPPTQAPSPTPPTLPECAP